ncbi:GTP-binding protein [Falsirhodobacter sp. alg1]|uniref:CobW family GTP-binding protein n=1 Tax=Falsirhodobacter sp. alg1 TaxID=1472418 RepID=UPI0005EDD7DA|nr:GTP-binding protein [Falsirhodobacter sp. alg1]
MRLTILAGYLGAGKTTWLRHQRHIGNFVPAHVIVNEAAGIPVDDALLTGAQVLAGGCCCCAGKEAFRTALHQRADLSSRGMPQDVVIETSGLADPASILEMIRTDPLLRHHFTLEPTTVLVDALHARDQLMSDALARRQITVADRIILTKVDQASRSDIQLLLGLLQRLAPMARIEGSHMGEPYPLPSASAFVGDLPDTANDPLPQAHTLHMPADMNWTAFGVWLSALLHARGRDIMRVKGVIRTPAGRLLVQTVRGIVQKPEVIPKTSHAIDNHLVFIGRGYDTDRLEQSFRKFARL